MDRAVRTRSSLQERMDQATAASSAQEAHFGPQAFDLVHEVNDHLNAGQVNAAHVAQILDAPQETDGLVVK